MDNRELDRRIATEFLGWQDGGDWWVDGTTLIAKGDFQPTEKAISCEEVLDEIEKRGWWYRFEYTNVDRLGPEYEFKIYDGSFRIGIGRSNNNRYQAICEAALQAIEEIAPAA